MRRSWFLALLPFLVAAKPGTVPNAGTSLPTMVPASGLYLRNSFDDDPTEYMGGFLMDAKAMPDETAATKLKCSTYVSYKEGNAGGATKKAYFDVSQSAALTLGFPPYVGGKVSGDRNATVLVQYKETKKWQARIADPGGFANCCATYPDQCREKYIGDFVGGTGGIYIESSKDFQAGVGVNNMDLALRLKVEDGREFALATVFPNEVAFAFKLKDAPLPNAAAMHDPVCDTDWANQSPPQERGHWETAVSAVLGDEAGARESARDTAAVQMAKWLSTRVKTSAGGARANTDSGSTIASGSQWSTMASGVIDRMDSVCTKVEKASMDNVVQYKVTGLFLLPAAQLQDAEAEAQQVLGQP